MEGLSWPDGASVPVLLYTYIAENTQICTFYACFLSVCLSVCPSVCRSVSRSVRQSVRACVRVCVCVCQPLGQGFPTATSTPTFYPQFHRQGGKASGDKPCPTKLSRWRGSTKGRFGVYLPQLLQKLSNPPCLIHGGCMFPPINLFPAAELVTASPVQIDFATTWKQCSTIHLRRLFHLAVLRLSSHHGN